MDRPRFRSIPVHWQSAQENSGLFHWPLESLSEFNSVSWEVQYARYSNSSTIPTSVWTAKFIVLYAATLF